ncbi:nitroreductase family protein [Candidatus Micrarchaeota archaeon]|nr:nitroreductase family protein [Candidatus Micrarchaeota archaeon]
MNLDEIVNNRYAVRKYKEDSVSDELIDKIMEVVRLAPTARNTQSQKFYVVNSRDMKIKMKEENVFPHDFVYTAPTILICTVDATKYPDSNEKSRKFGIMDGTISSAFLVLKAVELGLGSCYIGLIDEKKAAKVLNIPKEETVLFALTLGYPDVEQGERKRKSLENFYKVV